MKKKKTTFALFKANKTYLYELLKTGKFYIFLQLLGLIFVSPLHYWTTYAPKNFIDAITIDKNLLLGMLWVCVLIGIKFFNIGWTRILDIFKRRALSRAKIATKKKTYQKLEFINLTFFESPENLNNFNKALSYNENGGEFFINLLLSTLTSLIAFATMTYISLQFEWWLWLIILALVVFQFFTERFIKRKNFKFSMDRIPRDRKQNYFNGLPTNKDTLAEIKLNSRMAFFFNKYVSSFIENRNIQDKHDIKISFFSILFMIPSEVFNFVCYFIIATRLLDGTSTIGDYTLFFSMLGTINAQLKSIIVSINSYYEQALSAQVYLDFINGDHFSDQYTVGGELTSVDDIRFENVTFYYPGKAIPALDDVSLSIKKGERISIVGFNGAGKTTFIKLLTLLFQPSKGSVTVAGIPADKLNIKDFWNNIGAVFQNHQEFSMSLRDNIQLGNAICDDDIWRALDNVGIGDVVRETSKGLDLQVTRSFDSEGRDFSGGERQKIAIARVLTKNCELYIFDEPSSALDPLSEDQLYRCIQEIPEDKTVIFISHRLSCIHISTRVLFFKQGKIVADGPHEAIMESCEEYRNLYQMQSSKYIPGGTAT